MKRVIVFLTAWVVVGATGALAAGQEFYVEGEILAAFDWNRPFLTTESGPLAYSGVFAHEPGSSRATFEIVAGISAFSWPSTDLLFNKLYEGVVEDDAARLVVDLVSLPAPETWITSFELALDKTTGQGQWFWGDAPRELCTPTVCAPSVPGSSAVGTITAFRAVPEPGTGWLCVLIPAAISWGRTRRRPMAKSCGLTLL